VGNLREEEGIRNARKRRLHRISDQKFIIQSGISLQKFENKELSLNNLSGI